MGGAHFWIGHIGGRGKAGSNGWPEDTDGLDPPYEGGIDRETHCIGIIVVMMSRVFWETYYRVFIQCSEGLTTRSNALTHQGVRSSSFV